MSDKYNGWTNYETWCANLWLENDEGSYTYWHDAAQEHLDRAEGVKDNAASSLMDQLREEHESALEETLPKSGGLMGDLLNGAFQEINWYEIAESLLSDKEYAP